MIKNKLNYNINISNLIIKKIFIFVSLWSIIIISWCGSTPRFEFSFDEFNSYFNTENLFQKTDINIEWLSSDLLKNDIIKTYIQTNNNTEWQSYTDSIIIIKKISSKTLSEFVQDDIQKTKLNWYSHKDASTTKIKCNDQKLELNIVDSELNWNLNTTYFTQAFIKKTDSIFIVSFSSQNQDERDSFSSDIDKTKCK
jgi:hypothetical protein